eukprot:TRINITY_DN605_c0_g2_i1.p1 TRINITY_DN605_c0_g2~~TRINITY_DN605_c0_g2_i1.p1  ORF type:complete len:190 (+),score=47.38 TRINITY_DN605_c0_g2_i1:74-643(+)
MEEKSKSVPDRWFGIAPRQFQVLDVQWREGTRVAIILTAIVVLASFFAVLFLNYFGAKNSTFVSASGSSWSETCTLQEPPADTFLLSKTGKWSNTQSFVYNEALMQFQSPQGYSASGDGFKRALRYFSNELAGVQDLASTLNFADQVLYVTAKKWKHEETGIIMRYLVDPQLMMAFVTTNGDFKGVCCA